MSLYHVSGLPFWNEREIIFRETCIREIETSIKMTLTNINPAWKFFRCEAPVITPRDFISPNYTGDDVFELDISNWKNFKQKPVLRPETTPGSYAYATHLMKQNSMNNKPVKAPLCVWQAGKSFRVEKSDGATASKLRFNEFYQLEFQCIYSETTGVDYLEPIEIEIATMIKHLTGSDSVRIIDSDRLPSYSLKTRDVEVPYMSSPTLNEPNWREMASISIRKDFAEGYRVLEIAIGLDRLVMVKNNRMIGDKFNLALDVQDEAL